MPPVLPPLRARGGLSLQEALGDAAPLLPASQNDYRIDPNQELLAMGKRPLRAAGQGVGIRPQHRGVLQPFLLGAADQPWVLSPQGHCSGTSSVCKETPQAGRAELECEAITGTKIIWGFLSGLSPVHAAGQAPLPISHVGWRWQR